MGPHRGLRGSLVDREYIEGAIINVLQTVFRNGGKTPPIMDTTTPIGASLGLDSLDWAEVVIRLESELGYDPFQSPIDVELNTVADLVTLYLSGLENR